MNDIRHTWINEEAEPWQKIDHTINPSPNMFLPSCAMLPLLLCFFLHIKSQQCWCTPIIVPPTDKHKNKATWCKRTRYIFFLLKVKLNARPNRLSNSICFIETMYLTNAASKLLCNVLLPPDSKSNFPLLSHLRHNTRLQHTRLWASVIYFLSMIVRGWMVYIYMYIFAFYFMNPYIIFILKFWRGNTEP